MTFTPVSLLRGLAWTGAGALILILAVLAGAYVAARTAPGQAFIARQAEALLSDETMTVRLSPPRGNPFGSFTVDEIAVDTPKGGRLTVSGLAVDWNPGALLSGRLDVAAVDIRRVVDDGFFDAPPESADDSGSGVALPVGIAVGAIRVADIDLRSVLFGAPLRLSLDGSLTVEEAVDAARIDIRLRRFDGVEGRAEIALDYRARPARFAARVSVSEPEGGPVAALAGLPAGTPLSLSVSGEGPPEQWRGRLSAMAGSLVEAEADLTVAVSESGLTLSVDGGAEFAPLIPVELRPLAGPRFALRATIAYLAEGLITVSDVDAANGPLSIRGDGRYRLADGGLDGTVELEARLDGPDLFGVDGLSPAGVHIAATVSGSVAAPEVTARYATGPLGYRSFAATAATGEVAVASIGGGAWSLRGDIDLDGLDTGGQVPPGLLGTELGLRFDGFALEDGGVPHFGVSLSSGELSGTAAIAFGQDRAAVGDYELRLARLSPVAAPMGLPVEGDLSLKGRYRTGPAFWNVRGDVAGALAGLSGGPEWVSAVLGDTASFAADIAWPAGDALRVSGAKVETRLGRMTAEATLDPASGTLSAAYTARIDDIAGLSGLAGVPLAGDLGIDGSATGTLAAPRVRARARFGDLGVDNLSLGTMTVALDARTDKSAMRAAVDLGGTLRGKTLDGGFDLVVSETAMTSDNLSIRLGGNSIAGSAGFGFDGPRLSGELVATLADLADLPLPGTLPAIAGAATVRATVPDTGASDIAIALSGRGLRVFAGGADEIRARDLTVTVRIRDPFAEPTFDGTARLDGVELAAGTVERTDLTLRGTAARLDWTLRAGGDLAVPVTLSAAGRMSVAGPARSLTLESLEGTAEEYPVALLAPVRLQWRDDSLETGPVALSVDRGRLDLTASLAPQSVTGDARLSDLPVALAALLQPGLDLDGSLSATLTLRGTRRHPLLSLTVEGRDIRPRDIPAEDFAGISIDASLDQDASALRTTLRVSGPDGLRADATVETVALVSLDESGPGDGPLTGRMTLAGGLSMIDRIVGLGGDRLAGTVSGQAVISGSVRRPAVNGDLRLSGGAYEGIATGVVLRDLEVHIEFTGDEARLAAFSATDGREGTLTGSGAVAIADVANTTGDLTVALTRFTVLRRPEAEVVASGSVTVAGSLAKPGVAGELTVDSAEIRIPDKLPDSVAELDVVEVNGIGRTASPPEAAEPSLSHAFAVALDLSIRFPGRSFVRGRGLDSEWRGNLHIGGTSAEPVVTGQFDAVRGTFAFAGKTFVVRSGSVSFREGPAAEPEIDALAEAALTDLVAQVRIHGKASQPSITVSSEPPAPQEEVLAQILFGRSTGQLSAVQALQLAQTAATLSGTGGANVVDRIRQTLGVDVLNVDTGGETGRGATLKAGKYVSEDIFLSVSQGTEPGSQKVGVEVEVLPNVSVDIDVGGSESGNVGVNWKFDY